MPRKARERRVCRLPEVGRFIPAHDQAADAPEIRLSVEEYEVLRLLDLEGLDQTACAQQMGVARTTVQAIAVEAHRKVARMLVEGRPLVISGGTYQVCGCDCCDACGSCRFSMQRACRSPLSERKDNIMRIAVTFENDQIFQHFGHTAAFKCYDVEDGKVVSTQVMPTEGSGHGALAGFLTSAGVQALICGGIGPGARNALEEAGIKLYAGVSGQADAAVAAFLAGTLTSVQGATCDHHHDGEHTCGEHGCGEHTCNH